MGTLGEPSQKLLSKKSYNMNFKHKKHDLYAFLTQIISIKFKYYGLLFNKFELYILIWDFF